MKTTKSIINAAALAMTLATAGPALGSVENLDMFVGQTMTMSFDRVKRIAVGSPQVADVVTFPDRKDQLLLNAKTAGVTTLAVWDAGEQEPHEYRIRVSSQASAYEQSVYRFRNYTLSTTEYTQKDAGRTITTKVEAARVDHVANTLKPLLGDRFSIDGTRNQVTLRGAPEELATANALLAEIDKPLRQVLIEAEVIEITEGELKQLGNYLMGQSGRNSGIADLSGANTRALTFTFDTFTDLASHFKITLDMLKTVNVGKTLVHSKVAVLDGNLAWIQAGESLPVASREGQAGLVSFNYVDTGVILDVVTRVGEDDSITLWLRPEVSSVSGWVGDPNSGSGVAAPIIDSRQVMSEVRLQNGESVLIGGLRNESHTTVRKKVPILGDLPAIGSFFRKKSETSSTSELIISITPHILSEEEAKAYNNNYLDMSGTISKDMSQTQDANVKGLSGRAASAAKPAAKIAELDIVNTTAGASPLGSNSAPEFDLQPAQDASAAVSSAAAKQAPQTGSTTSKTTASFIGAGDSAKSDTVSKTVSIANSPANKAFSVNVATVSKPNAQTTGENGTNMHTASITSAGGDQQTGPQPGQSTVDQTPAPTGDAPGAPPIAQ